MSLRFSTLASKFAFRSQSNALKSSLSSSSSSSPCRVFARSFSVVVLAEHNNKKLNATTSNAVTAALKFGQPVTVLVAGSGCSSVGSEASLLSGVSSVVVSDHPELEHGLAENVDHVIQDFFKKTPFDVLLSPTSSSGKNILPRVAAKLNVQPISDVISILSPNTFKRPMYAGNVLATFESSDKIKVLTVRPTAYEPAQQTQKPVPISNFSSTTPFPSYTPTWTADELSVSARPDLTAAKVVVSGGRALKSAANFGLLEELADLLGGAVGASRAAVDAGFAPNDYQVGQTGKVVAPDLYIAVGISGAIQHLAGMKDSRCIVAINKDGEAPIFQVADYGLVADLFKAVPELTAEIKALKAK